MSVIDIDIVKAYHNVYSNAVYSRNGAVPVILSCTDHMFFGL